MIINVIDVIKDWQLRKVIARALQCVEKKIMKHFMNVENNRITTNTAPTGEIRGLHK